MSQTCQCSRPVADAYVCSRCAKNGRYQLGRIPDLAAELDTAIARQTAFGAQMRDYVTGSTGQPLPLDWDASAIAAELQHTLTKWTVLVLHETGDPIPGPTCDVCRHPSCVQIRARKPAPANDEPATLAAWLRGHVEWFRHKRYGYDFINEVRDITNRCEQTIDVPANRAAFNVGPCPEHPHDTPCPGWVRAIIPDQQPAYMACIECETRWETWQWRRAGKRIMARKLGA